MTARFPEEPSREVRLDELEKRVRRLEEALLAGADRGASREIAREAVEREEVARTEAAAGPAQARPGAGSLVLDVLAQTGWSVLTLAGAFLIRALTDRGTMATTPGVAFGLAYAFGVILLADRAVARGSRMTAAFLGSTGAFIANAIVAETTTRFAIFSPAAGLCVLAAATAIALGLGRRDDLPAVAWTATLAACGTAVFLALESRVPALSGMLLLLLATVALWLATERWPWRLLAWPPTLCAVTLSVWATSAALGPAAGPGAGVLAILLALGFPLLWPGSVLVRALLGRPRVGGLDVVQLALALSLGLGGAFQLARADGVLTTALAAAALLCGIGAYARAYLRERETEARDSRLYFDWLGLALVLIGSGALLPAPAPALLWSVLALVVIVVGRTYEPSILQPQGAVFAAAAAVASVLLSISVLAFTAADAGMRPATFPSLLTLAVVTAAAIVLFLEKPAAGGLPGFATALLAALGLGGLAVLLLRHPAAALLTAPLPALRTVIVSLSAYALARLWRSTGRKELRTLAYMALVAGGIKLLVEDLPSGTPLTLFVAFVFYGGALLLIPRLMRAGAAGSSVTQRA
jgi:hypothetical protein